MNKTSTIHFDLPTNKKATYVKAARRNEQKLIPWILDVLDVAASETPTETELNPGVSA